VGQDDYVEEAIRPSWKNYILQYFILVAMVVAVSAIAFSDLTGTWGKTFYMATIASVVLIIVRILIDKLMNNKKTEWKRYIVQYLLIFAIVVAMGIVTYGSPGAEMKKNLCIAGMIYILGICCEVTIFRRGERFTIKKDKVLMELGIFRKKYTEIRYNQIRTTHVKQTIWQRLINIGDLHVVSSGSGEDEIVARGIDKPHYYKEKIPTQESIKLKEEVKPQE